MWLHRDQDFRNYVAQRDYRRAIELALSMSQPGRLYSLFNDIASEPETASLTGKASVDEVIRNLAGSDLATLFEYVRDWNTNAKSSAVAQTILFAIFKLHSPDAIMQAFGDELVEKELSRGEINTSLKPRGSHTALHDLVEALVPYSERHLSRMSKLVQESYVLDFILGEMDDGMLDDDLSDSNDMLVE